MTSVRKRLASAGERGAGEGVRLEMSVVEGVDWRCR
jgi:hypothetical protein